MKRILSLLTKGMVYQIIVQFSMQMNFQKKKGIVTQQSYGRTAGECKETSAPSRSGPLIPSVCSRRSRDS
jgi:hypothetical protein